MNRIEHLTPIQTILFALVNFNIFKIRLNSSSKVMFGVLLECGWRGDRGEPALRHLCHNHPLNLST